MIHPKWVNYPLKIFTDGKVCHAAFGVLTKWRGRETLCGTNMPRRANSWATLPWIYEMVDCGKCKATLSCDPQSVLRLKRFTERWFHCEFSKYGTCSPPTTHWRLFMGYYYTSCNYKDGTGQIHRHQQTENV